MWRERFRRTRLPLRIPWWPRGCAQFRSRQGTARAEAQL